MDTYCWTKGRRKFFGKYGTKTGYAKDLLIFGDIKLSKRDFDKLDIKYKYEIPKITNFEAAKMLESKGWKWKKN